MVDDEIEGRNEGYQLKSGTAGSALTSSEQECADRVFEETKIPVPSVLRLLWPYRGKQKPRGGGIPDRDDAASPTSPCPATASERPIRSVLVGPMVAPLPACSLVIVIWPWAAAVALLPTGHCSLKRGR